MADELSMQLRALRRVLARAAKRDLLPAFVRRADVVLLRLITALAAPDTPAAERRRLNRLGGKVEAAIDALSAVLVRKPSAADIRAAGAALRTLLAAAKPSKGAKRKARVPGKAAVPPARRGKAKAAKKTAKKVVKKAARKKATRRKSKASRGAGFEPMSAVLLGAGGVVSGLHGIGSGPVDLSGDFDVFGDAVPGKQGGERRRGYAIAAPPPPVDLVPEPPPPEPPEPAPPKAPSERPKRYANAVLLNAAGKRRFNRRKPLPAKTDMQLRLDIGALSAESQVCHPEAFPEEKLPDIDLDLDVMVSSTDFTIAAGKTDKPGDVAHGHFLLPRDGEPARADDGGTYLHFRLQSPQRAGPARCRIGYYYRNVLVQSQLLRADIGTGKGFSIETDYTMSRNFSAGLAAMPARPRISVLTNDNSNGEHQIVLRAPGEPAPENGATFTVGTAKVGSTIKTLRSALAFNAPTSKARTPAQLTADLTALAPLGWMLFAQVPGRKPRFFAQLRDKPQDFVVQVTRPEGSGFAFPWGLIYEIPITENGKLKPCKLITDWDGKKPLVEPSQRTCPHGPHTKDSDVLCPFGFWGFRYAIDQISKSDEAAYTITVPANSVFAMGETQYQVDIKALSLHAQHLAALLAKVLPSATLEEGKDLSTIEAMISHDLPFVYFYCHGERLKPGGDTYLGVGNHQTLTAQDIIGLVQRTMPMFWNVVRPLVFINACHSLEIDPDTLVSYLDAFISSAEAAGVIGTEVKVSQTLAMDVAEQFFSRFLSGQTVEEALRAVRMDYLASGNLFGLVYTPYCWSELKLLRAN